MKFMKQETFLFIIFLTFNMIYCQLEAPTFKCFHNDSEEKHPLPNRAIKYDKSSKRRIDDEVASDGFKEFNITLDTKNVENDIEKLGLQNQKDFFISSMKKAVETLQTLLRVRPLDKNLGYYLTDNDFKSLNISKWDEEKFGDKALAKGKTFQSQGIDLAIFGTFVNLPESTLATASAKAFQNITNPNNISGQPYVGIVKINPNINYSIPNSQIYFESILVHEFTHILGFSKHFFETYFKNIVYSKDEFGFNRMYLNSPKLLEVAKKYYNCDSLTGVELEDQGGDGTAGSHWEARILLGEYMNGYSYTEEQVISEFTLAVLEDSGYYKPNYYTGGLMRFGKNKGCKFLQERCINQETHKVDPDFENEFYDSVSSGNIEASCSSGRQSRTYNAYWNMPGLPKKYQYFENPNITGYQPADYCPVPLKFQDEEDKSYFAGHCSIIGSGGYGSMIRNPDGSFANSQSMLKYTGENYSDHSFCYLSSLVKEGDKSKFVSANRANCYETFCSEKSLTIRIFDDYIVCPRAGGKIKVDGYEGYLLCPDYNLICSGTELCNNIFDCVEKKSLIKEDSYIYDYNIKTSQNFAKAKEAEADDADNYELSQDGKCPQYCKHCIKNKCLKCASGYGRTFEKEGVIKCYDENLFTDGYYKNEQDIYIKCIDNCTICKDLKSCERCKDNFKYYNKKCVEISEDDPYIENCMEYNSQEPDKCNRCVYKYGFKQNNKSVCYSVENLTDYYSKDNITYLPCESQVENCIKCFYKKSEFRTICTQCKNEYLLLNKGKGQCKTKEEIENNTKYYIINDTHAGSCSNDIENCVSCESINNCTKCKYTYVFDNEKGKCVEKSKLNTQNSENDNSTESSNDNKGTQGSTKPKTKTSSKRRVVKKNNKENNSSYFSLSSIIMIQAIYAILLLIKF